MLLAKWMRHLVRGESIFVALWSSPRFLFEGSSAGGCFFYTSEKCNFLPRVLLKKWLMQTHFVLRYLLDKGVSSSRIWFHIAPFTGLKVWTWCSFWQCGYPFGCPFVRCETKGLTTHQISFASPLWQLDMCCIFHAWNSFPKHTEGWLTWDHKKRGLENPAHPCCFPVCNIPTGNCFSVK